MTIRSRRPTARIRRTIDDRQAILKRFRRSGLGPTEFCRREDLSLSSLQRWRREMGAKDPSPDFVELSLPAAAIPPTGPWSLELDLPGGLSLRLRGGA